MKKSFQKIGKRGIVNIKIAKNGCVYLIKPKQKIKTPSLKRDSLRRKFLK